MQNEYSFILCIFRYHDAGVPAGNDGDLRKIQRPPDDINIVGMNMNVKIVNIISLIPLTNLKIRIIICA